ncbi:MAG: Nif3-like dinuclear metal center hexameric protein [Alphaproteobacteria bacterium]|nr:Nif3-like dinuclear metal center hexameric protein [Alphaproteobacteria bacterium]
MQRDALVNYLNELLQPARFHDYCPNGLQVEGRAEIRRLVTGVTASQALLAAAADRGADAVLVHHGYFWKGEDGRVTGIRKQRLATLLAHDMSLLAYHLPLDGHAELGNNAQLAALFGFRPEGRFAEQDIGWFGTMICEDTVAGLAARVTHELGRAPQVIGDPDRPVRRIAWCSGGAQTYFEEALAKGIDAYLTGEIAEPMVHLARESGVAYIAAGHHATERGGVRALAAHLREHCGLDCEFVDIDNPV